MLRREVIEGEEENLRKGNCTCIEREKRRADAFVDSGLGFDDMISAIDLLVVIL